MTPLPDSVKKLIELKSYANLATLMRDGSPHVIQTWVDHDGDTILINTNFGSQKHKNVERNPKVALDICDPNNAYNMAIIRGVVSEITTVGANEHVDKLAMKYLGQEKYPMTRPGMKRVLLKIQANRVIPPYDDNPRWRDRSQPTGGG